MLEDIARCRWPDLAQPYEKGLRNAVAHVLERFDVVGIVASGAIVRGNPDPASDIDLYVVNVDSKRQRIQRFFNSVPCEIFLNPVHAIERYFKEEQREGKPSTAHMLATGFVVLAKDDTMARLRKTAEELLRLPPTTDEHFLCGLRYASATLFEDACDVAERDPSTAALILGVAVDQMLQYWFLESGRHIPRRKDILSVVCDIEPAFGKVVRQFFAPASDAERLRLAKLVADKTIRTQGFFEWESDVENA